ncbi:CotH kinase family protein, partial [Akkermansiaceae bacterium]|nr:CotH kinase family protein [Akkermansiaceae bacterium]
FNFATRGKYGDDELKYNLFPGSNIPIFTALTIREGGDDYGAARLTDAIFDPISEDKLEVESNKLQAATVFINGEYWGHYNIRDRWDDNWFFQHYGVNNEEYDHLRFENTGATPNIENGSLDEWLDFYDFIQSNDLNDPAIWQFVESRIDLESFMDFVVVESWANNSSWTGNREVWKAHRAGAKWRWFIPDMDRTFRSDGTLGGMISREQTLRHLVQSDRFRGLLAQRFAAHLASTFTYH